MRRRRLGLALLLVLPAACALPEDHPERVDWLRIAAIVAEPPETVPGDTVTLDPLIATPAGATTATQEWYVCEPLVQVQELGLEPAASLCADPAGWTPQAVAAGGTLVVPDVGSPPSPGDPFFVPLILHVNRDEETTWALKRLWISASGNPNQNPVIDGLIVDKEDPGTGFSSVPPDTSVSLQSLASDPDDDPLRIEYLVTAGTIEENTSEDPTARIFWHTPTELGDVTVWAIVRDNRGGTAYTARLARVE